MYAFSSDAAPIDPQPKSVLAPPDHPELVAVGEDCIVCVDVAHPGEAGFLLRIYPFDRPPDPVQVSELHCIYVVCVREAWDYFERVWSTLDVRPRSVHRNPNLVIALHSSDDLDRIRAVLGWLSEHHGPRAVDLPDPTA